MNHPTDKDGVKSKVKQFPPDSTPSFLTDHHSSQLSYIREFLYALQKTAKRMAGIEPASVVGLHHNVLTKIFQYLFADF